MSVDYNTIHAHLKKLKAQAGSGAGAGASANSGAGASAGGQNTTQLDEATAVTYISALRQDLIALVALNKDSSPISTKVLNEIIIFTKTLDYVPKSDQLFQLFDSQLFKSLFDLLLVENIPIEILRGVLRICLTYLAGVLPKTRKQGMFRVLLGVLCEQVSKDVNRCDVLFANLTARVTFADSRMNLNIVDFVAKVLYRLMETIGSVSNDANSLILEEQWLLNVVRSLYNSNFFGILSCVKGIGEIEGMTGLRGSMDLTYKWLRAKKFTDDTNPIVKELISMYKEVGIVSAPSDTEMLSILTLVGILKQPKRSLKKMLVECNMTSKFPILKFISKINDEITTTKSFDKIFGNWNTDLLFSLLNVSTRCWLFSGAKIEDGDTEKVLNMVNIVIHWLSEQLQIEKTGDYDDDEYDIVTLLETVDSFNYQKIKSLQLKEIHSNINKKWETEMEPFENLIHHQVVALVKDLRFFQLSKGSWVYSSNPLEYSDSHHYFLTVNSNSQSIVYKEFAKRPEKSSFTPNLDKDGIHIEFKSILAIEATNLNPNVSNTSLINIQSERMDVNHVEVITKTGIFSFYTDTKILKDTWVDGLRILVADSKPESPENIPMNLSVSEEFFAKNSVSEEVKKQVKTLEDIRIRTQMLNLEDTEKDNQQYIPETSIDWASLSSNFVYE